MSDISIVDCLLNKFNDKNPSMDLMTDAELDHSYNFENPDLMTSDFFDPILSMERSNFDECNLQGNLFENLEMDLGLTSDGSVTYDEIPCESSVCSDSGVSSDQQEVHDQILSDDEIVKSILDGPVEQKAPPSPVQNIQILKSVELSQPIIVHSSDLAPKRKIINIIKKPNKLIKVQPISGNSRSVILPILKDYKTIKIINANDLKAENINFTTASLHSARKSNMEKIILQNPQKCKVQEIITTKQEPKDSHEDSQYPLLMLTTEEKRLLNKDGIQLPCRYPLTKNEERELKRIRRKIRNKISAQDSRKRKKEYVDGLEERVKLCSEENRSLLKRIKVLQTQNTKLSSQLSKLQALVFRTGTSRAHPATCLMIVLLSVMLVTLPNLRGLSQDKQLNSLQQAVTRRVLLSSQQATNEDTLNMDDLITFPSKGQDDSSSDDAVTVINTTAEKIKVELKEPFDYEYKIDIPKYDGSIHHDYGEFNVHRGKLIADHDIDNNMANIRKRYIEPDIDDYVPSKKKSNVYIASTQLDQNQTKML